MWIDLSDIISYISWKKMGNYFPQVFNMTHKTHLNALWWLLTNAPVLKPLIKTNWCSIGCKPVNKLVWSCNKGAGMRIKKSGSTIAVIWRVSSSISAASSSSPPGPHPPPQQHKRSNPGRTTRQDKRLLHWLFSRCELELVNRAARRKPPE